MTETEETIRRFRRWPQMCWCSDGQIRKKITGGTPALQQYYRRDACATANALLGAGLVHALGAHKESVSKAGSP